ncbi:MAG: hypothetical protein J1F66_03030 [Clostridiales bacterium]|nr:hypothetical protein [Clostridiales bacterium]
MANTQVLYNSAVKSYDEITLLMTKMCNVLKDNGVGVNNLECAIAFDYGLQYFLLRLSGGKINSSEGDFIDKICRYKSVFNLFDKMPDYMCWRWLAMNESRDTIKEIIHKLFRPCEIYMTKVAEALGVADALMPANNYMNEIVRHIYEIMEYYDGINSVYNYVTLDAEDMLIRNYFTNPWTERKNKFLKYGK